MDPWYEKMTATEKEEVLDYLSFNARSATRFALAKFSQTIPTSKDFSEKTQKN